jgi:hypothetical protein
MKEGPKFKSDNLDEFSLYEVSGVTDAQIVGKFTFQLIFCHERIDCALSLKILDYPILYLGPLVLHQEPCSLSKKKNFSKQNKAFEF